MARGPLLTAADVGHCRHRVALERGAAAPVTVVAVGAEIAKRVRDAADHRRRIVNRLVGLHDDAVVVQGYEATLSALQHGAPLVLGGKLADTGSGQRIANFDVLVRVEDGAHGPAYAPLLIKNNEATEPAATRRLLRGELATPQPLAARWEDGVGVRRNDVMVRNGFALDHATRLLEAFGVADPLHRGGLVDRRGQLWWFNLDDREWGKWRLSEYDHAYDECRIVLTAHERWRAGDGPFPTEPYWHRECVSCPFQQHCEHELEQRDDVSLVRFTNEAQQRLLNEHGIRTRRDLAQLDPVLAAAARTRVLSLTQSHTAEEHLGHAIDKLDELIYRARSVVAHSPLLKVPAATLSCPTADVEVDVDMESYNDVTYLWGALVTVRREVPGLTAGYVHFVDWSDATVETEVALFRSFWTWFEQVRALARTAGASFAAYCFWAQAENSAMNRAADDSTRAALDQFRRNDQAQWIDLHEVVRRQIQTDGPLGLKALAKEAGFAWRDANPSGEASMTWFEEARGDTPAAMAARDRLLEYNEDDCRATRALREWLNGDARRLPSRDVTP